MSNLMKVMLLSTFSLAVSHPGMTETNVHENLEKAMGRVKQAGASHDETEGAVEKTVKGLCRDYVIDRETIDHITEKDRWKKVLSLGSDEVWDEFMRMRGPKDSNSFGEHKQATRSVHILASSRIDDNIYQVDWESVNCIKGLEIEKKQWRSTLTIEARPDRITKGGEFNNPTGFTVIKYTVSGLSNETSHQNTSSSSLPTALEKGESQTFREGIVKLRRAFEEMSFNVARQENGQEPIHPSSRQYLDQTRQQMIHQSSIDALAIADQQEQEVSQTREQISDVARKALVTENFREDIRSLNRMAAIIAHELASLRVLQIHQTKVQASLATDTCKSDYRRW